eukprot:UN20408
MQTMRKISKSHTHSYSATQYRRILVFVYFQNARQNVLHFLNILTKFIV